MKKLLLIIACLGSIKAHSANISENPESKKRTRKNLFELGGSAAWFFNKYPIDYNSEGWIGWLPIRMEITSPIIPSYFKYAHSINQKTMLGISTYTYGVLYKEVGRKIGLQEAKKGEIWRRVVNDISLGLDYYLKEVQLNRFTSIRMTISPSVSYRWGVEQVYLNQNMFGDVIYTCRCRYNSIGLGTGANVDIVLGNRLYIGGFLGYTHYFEKSRLPKDDPYYFSTYKPNRDVLRLHPKIGVLF
jgi:hypothetical protein